MIARTLLAILVLFALCGLWFALQALGRRFAKNHPEFGRYREEGGECGKTCGCANWKHCVKKNKTDGPDQANLAESSFCYSTSPKEPV
jgi:hypothetical protein